MLTASDFWGGAGSAACQGFITQLGRNFQVIYDQGFITQLGRNFQVIYEQANAHGQKVQAAGNNMAQTDSAVVVISGTTIGPTPPSAFRLNGIPGIVISGTTIGPTPPSAFRPVELEAAYYAQRQRPAAG